MSEQKKPWEQNWNQPTANNSDSTNKKPWEQNWSEEKTDRPKDKGFLGQAKDHAVSFLGKGTVAVGEVAVGLSDMMSDGATGKILSEKLGYDPKAAKNVMTGWQSEQYQQQLKDSANIGNRKIEEGDDFATKVGKKFDNAVDITKNAINNPSLITNTVAESLPSMLLGGVLGRASGIANPVVAGAVGEVAVMAGSQAEQIRQETVDGRLTADQSLAGAATGALGGLFGYAGGRLAQKMGLSDVDTAMQTGRLTTQQVGEEIAKTPMSAIPTAVIKGAISEGFLEELPQSVSEQILQNLALDKPWHDGVENAAVMGTLAGMAMGGTVSGAGKTGDWWNSRSDTGAQDSQQQSGSPNLPSAPPQLGSSPDNALTGEYIPRENVPQGANQGRTAFVYDQPSMEADNLLNNNYKSDADFDTSGNFDPSNNPDSPLSPSGGNYFEDHSTQPQLPSERLGINPDDGPMSAAAALAVDSGATTSMLNAPAVTDTAQDDVNNNAPLSSAAGLLNAPNENNSTITGTNANSNATYSTGNSVDGSNESSLRNDTNTPLDMLLGSSSETQAEAGTGTDMATQKVAEPILGADGKNKWFGSQEKAQAFLDKKNLGNDYQVAQDGKRFEIQPKSQVAQNQNDNLNNQNSILNTKNTISNTENNIDKIQKISALEQQLANEKSVIKKVRLRKQITELQNGLDQNQVSASLDEPRKATAENLSGEFKRMEQATARVNAVRQRMREANPEIFTAENDRVRETHGLTNARVTSIADEIETSGNYELSDREYEKIKNNPNYKIDYDARNFMGKVTAVKDPHSGEWVGNNEQTDLNDAAVPVQDDAHFQSKLDQLDKQRAQFESSGDYANAEKVYDEMQTVAREWQSNSSTDTPTTKRAEPSKGASDNAWGDFYRKNRNMMSEELFAGGHQDRNTLEEAAPEIQSRHAHGMAKATPAAAVRDLKDILENGIDQNRGQGRLFTAPLSQGKLTAEQRSAMSQSGTSSGSAYSDGAFTLIAKDGVGDIRSVSEIDAVMVNSAVPQEVVDGLRQDFPNTKFGYANELQGLLSGSKQSNNSQSKVADIESQHPVNKWQEEMNKALEKADPEHPLFKKLQASAKNGLRSVSDRAVALRQAREIEKKAEAPKTEQPKVKVSENKFVTDERRAELEKRIKAKLSQLNSGVDPELIVLGTELALYHIERGVRTFAAYAKAMTESLGDSSKPFLKSWYMGVKFDPRASGFDGMSSSAEVENFDVDGTLTNEGTMTGKTETVVTPAGREFEVRHKVVEASDLITSNLDSGAINAEYPQALQPRDRTTLKSVTQVNDIANKLNPKLLGDSASSTNGAPIVSPGNEVESGNGRTLAIRKAYQIGKADAYKAWLAEQGYDVDNMQQPVLVRERITPMNMAERVAYTTESNERETLDMSPSEQAMSDAPKVMDILHLVQGGSFNNTANRDFVNAFLTDVASKNERGTMLDKDGVSLTQDGYRRIESALLAAAFNDAQIISQVIESKDSDIKAIGNALIEAAPQWAQVRKGVQDGILVEGVNVEANLVEAVHLVRKARQQNLSLSEMLNQDDIFDGSIDQVTKDFISIFYSGDKLNKARSSQKVAEALKSYAQLAMTAKATPNLFGDAPLSNEQILGQVHEKLRQSEAEKQQDIFTSPQSNEPDAGTVGGGRSGRGTGPRSETAQEQSEPTKALKKTAPTSEKETIQDFGEKIGGARKDTSVKTGPKTSGTTTKDNRPTWAKRFEITEIAASSNPNEVGKWIITDTRKKDWKGNAKQLGKQFFDSQKDAELALPILAVAQKHRVWAAGKDSFSIYREISDRKRVKVVEQEFQTREDAMKYMAIHAIEILETNTTFGEIDLPRPENTVRKGLDRRKGDAKDADFIRVFGFRGVEFGNWNNQAERQELLNDAFDGLMDLAEILNIPPAAISLNGELALAFGARGQGLSGAKAHYEPERAVINLTKLNGAGSLAHEWWHALDHYFGRQDGKAPSEWVTNADGSRSLKIAKHFEDMSVTSGFSYKSNVREDVQEAYKQLVQTIFRKSENYIDDTVKVESFVSSARNNLKDQLDKLRADLNRELDPKYYKRFNKAASAEQLAEFDTVAELLLTGTALTTEIRHNNNKNSRNIFSGARWSNDALDKLSVIYKSVRGRSGFNAEQKGVLDRLRQYMNTYAQRLKLLAEAQNGTEKAKMIPTDFAMNAKELDQGRGTDYWITTPEMTARAFQGYVEDKISQNSGYSPFLNFGPESAAIFTPWGFKRPFPTGTERKAINAKFSDLVDTLKTEETETGIKLYSRDKLKPDNERRGTSPLNTTFNALSVVSATRRVLSVLQHLKIVTAQIDASVRGRIVVGGQRVGVNKVKGLDSHSFMVQVVESFDGLPSAIQEDNRYQGENGETKRYDVLGVWHNGTLYINAGDIQGNNSTQQTTFEMYEELILHEVVGHFGVQQIFGREYKTKLQQLFNALGGLEGIRKIAKDNGVDMQQFNDVYINPRMQAVKDEIYTESDVQQSLVGELFAFVAQNAKSRPFVRQKLKEVIGYIRQWFRDRGFDKFLSRYNDTDLMMFIAEARKAVVDQSYFGKFEDQNISTKQDSNIPQYSRSKNENNKTDNIESLDAWKEFAKNQGISISAHESGDLITLNKIVVPTAERNSGIGSRIMQALVDYADSHKKHIALSPSSDFGGNTAKLKSFYKRFGFIENKGGNKVYQTSETMYREVDGKTLFSRSSSETKNNTSVKQVREVLVQRFGGDVIESLEKQGKLNIRQSYNIEGVEGFYQNGRITLIADNLNDDSIVPTFLHELGGHGGFQNLMSKAKYAELMRMFDEMVKRGDPIALAAKELAERESGTERQQLEYLPYLLTLASTMQQKNALQRNFLQRFISQVVSAVKAWAFDRLGININLNHNDMVALAERMISSSQKYRIQKAKGKDLNRSNENHINADFSMASVWTGLSQDGDAFQLPVSKKTEFTELANALNSDLIVEEIPTRNSDSRYDKLFQVYLPNKKIVMVIQKGREVWINASQLKEGSRGKEIYNLVANYAHNNELVFIGDPVGLSDRAMTRRLENMLSSALKFGTTKHLAPHANQVKGNAVVKPLDWIVGDHIHNVEQMMFASYEAVATVYPEIKNIKYNAEKDIFEGVATGRIKENSQESIREFTRDDFEKLAKNARQSPLKLSSEYAPTSGSTTLERAVLTQTFIKGTAQDRLDIKERLQRIGSNRLTMDNAVLFSRRTKSNSGSTTQQVRDVLIDRFGKETIDELERQGKLEIIQDYQVEGVEGFYYNGKAVLVASNLTAESTVPTFLHELGGHAGFQNMMNQKQYNELMNQFNKLVEQGNPVALAAKMLAEREQGSERQQLEYLPYLLTLSSTMQQRNVIQRNALQKLINNIVSYVKAWVFDNFGINLNLNPDDMLALSERMIGQIKHQSSLDLIRQKYHGTNQWMTAPNGAKTHLSEQQWLQVRTPEFKKWFGDWENDAANASQVLDENGEPKVVYHGTATEFNEFKQGHGLLGDGIYLTDSFDTADVYANIRGENGFVLPLFVNIRNVFKTTGNVSRDEFVEATTSGKYQGIVHQFENHEYIVALEPNQVKMADGNKGTFNSESSDIRFSRSAKDIIDNLSKNLGNISISSVKDKTGYKFTDWLGVGLSALGRRQLTEIYSKILPQLNKYNELAAQMDADKNDAGAEADSIVREWANLNDEDQLAELMHDSTLAKIDPTKPYVKGDSVSRYKQLRDDYNSLSPEAQAMYLKARDAYKKHYAKVHQAIKERILRSELSSQKKADLLKQMDDNFFGYVKGVYFPLARFGKYVVVMRNQNGEVESVSRAETMGEAQALRSELIQKFPHYKVNKVKLDKEYNKSRDAVGRGFMTSLFAEVDNLGLSTAERTEFEDTLSQLYLSSMPDLSWAKHGIHRKGTAGFSQDARRAFAQNMFSGANYLAKLRYGDQLAQQLDEMQKYADEQFEVDEDYDQRSAQSVITEMNKRHDNLMNPKGHPLSSALTSLGFIYYLGLSPAAAMVNLSQTALVAYPFMGAKWGFDNAANELLKASNDFRKGVEFHKVKWEGTKTDLYKAVSSDISKFLTKDEQAAYQKAVGSSVIDVTQAHDLAGIAQGEDSGIMWKTRPIMRAASVMFHSAERFNREVTFIAAYRLARQSGSNHDEAYTQAHNMTYKSHYDYGSGNRPRIMQGNVAKVLLLFKQFGQNMIYTLARQTYQSIKGETEAERREARRALGAILAMHATFAGALGLPVVGMLLSVASWMGGDDDEPWDAEVALRNYLAEAFNPTISNMLMKGVPRGIGVDISSRVGINNLLLPDVQEGLEGKKWWDSAASAALGPIGGIGANIAKGAQEISEGHNLRGVESMLPVFLKNFAKTYRYADEGVQDKTGVSIMDEVSSMDLLVQGMGFSPSDVRTANEGKTAIYQLNRKLNERRSRLMTLWSRAKMMDDQQEMDEIWEEIQGFNDKNPSRRITRMNLNQSYRNRQRRIDRAEDGIYLSRNRQDAREAGYFAFGE